MSLARVAFNTAMGIAVNAPTEVSRRDTPRTSSSDDREALVAEAPAKTGRPE